MLSAFILSVRSYPAMPLARQLVHQRYVRPGIAKDSRLQPPVGVWAVSQSQCGRPPSQAGYPSLPW